MKVLSHVDESIRATSYMLRQLSVAEVDERADLRCATPRHEALSIWEIHPLRPERFDSPQSVVYVRVPVCPGPDVGGHKDALREVCS
jgi:hypothetical protein